MTSTVRAIFLDPTEPNRAFVRNLTPDLATLQAAVGGGFIEPLRLDAATTIYMNEDGKTLRMAANGAANKVVALLNPGLADGDFLVGPVVLVGSLDADGEDDGVEHDVPETALESCRRAGLEIVDETDGRP